ncbi:MAG: triose-phosphate isomerase [bacterium]|nr:triose-phosphate isomerase [bacterium]
MKPLIIANWKMNPKTPAEAERLFNSVSKGVKNIKKVEVVVCPPFIYLSQLKKTKYGLLMGAQDCFWEEMGAFTGEIGPIMLKNIGCQYVIVGHSERRKYQRETGETINKKVKAVLAAGLKPILCIANLSQLKKELNGVAKEIIVAYEPLFAIGTGQPCSVEKARKMRKLISASQVLYGGSVNPQNAVDYIVKAGFQGLLVGGISLDAKQFLQTVNGINKAKA